MSDILIRGMEMPTGNDELRLIIHSNGQVIIDKKTYWEEAEAVPVPEHGDLIDRDVLLDEQVPATLFPCGLDGKLEVHTNAVAVGDVMYAPTIFLVEDEHTMEEFMYGQEGNPNDGSM